MRLVKTSSGKQRRGAAVVEFAVVAPLMFTLFFGMVEIGRAVMVGQLSVTASREGARMAVQTGSSVTDVQNFVKDYLEAAGIPTAAITVAIENQNSAGGSFGATGNLSAVATGMGIRCNVDINFAQVTWLPQNFAYSVMPSGAVISGTTTMRKE
jgi:Flp pilus assembly protein TadG